MCQYAIKLASNSGLRKNGLSDTALLLAVLAGVCLFRLKLGLVPVLAISAGAGLLLNLIGL